jgi:hypothetical protein
MVNENPKSLNHSLAESLNELTLPAWRMLVKWQTIDVSDN